MPYVNAYLKSVTHSTHYFGLLSFRREQFLAIASSIFNVGFTIQQAIRHFLRNRGRSQRHPRISEIFDSP